MASVPDFDHIHPDVYEPLAPTLSRSASHVPIQAATSTSTRPLRVAVSGGGIGGLSLALGLLQYPHLDVQVYEAAHNFGEIGAGIGVGINAEHALELLGPQVYLAFLRQATRCHLRFALGGPEGARLLSPEKTPAPFTSLHRAHFLDELVALMPKERSHFGKRLVRLEDQIADGGHMTLHFKDGTSAEADVVIGADGIHSPTRQFVLGGEGEHPELAPTYSGVVAYRNLIPMQKVLEKLGGDFATNARIWFLEGGMFMVYPVDHFQSLNIVVCSWKFSEWRRKEWVVPVSPEEVLKSLDGKLDEPLIKLIKLFERPSAWSLWDLPSLPTYHRSRVAILGDAAHATTPFVGQGAGQAIEDATTLTALFAHVKTIGDIEPALAAYDEIRRPRGNKVVTTSRRSGRIMSLQDDEIRDPTDVADSWPKRMGWVFGKDMQGQCDEAVQAFNKIKEGGMKMATP